jgi:hypothetical protein
MTRQSNTNRQETTMNLDTLINAHLPAYPVIPAAAVRVPTVRAAQTRQERFDIDGLPRLDWKRIGA